MKTVGAPGEQKRAIFMSSGESILIKRVVILAHGCSSDDAAREDNIGIPFVGRLRMVQQCVLARA